MYHLIKKRLNNFVNVFLQTHSKFKKESNNNSTQKIDILSYKSVPSLKGFRRLQYITRLSTAVMTE